MSDEQDYRILYGVHIAPPKRVQLDRLVRHDMNPLRKLDREKRRGFHAEIKKNKVERPILITKDGEVLRGWRRCEGAIEAGEKTIMAETVVERLDPSKPRDQAVLRQLIFRDNILPEGYTPAELEQIILDNYKGRLFTPIPRGPHASKSSNQLLESMERVLEVELGLTQGTAKFYLARIRKRLNLEAAIRARRGLTVEDERTGLAMARRWQALEDEIVSYKDDLRTKLKEFIKRRKKEQTQIMRDLSKLGGLEHYKDKVKPKKK